MNTKASDFLEPEQASDFSELIRRVHEYNKIREALHPHLTEEMQKYCIFSTIRDNIVFFLIPLSTASAIIHYQIPDVLIRLQNTKEFKHIEKIQCKIIHEFTTRLDRPASLHTMPLISDDNSRIIQEQAEHIEDEALREILLRISQRTR